MTTASVSDSGALSPDTVEWLIAQIGHLKLAPKALSAAERVAVDKYLGQFDVQRIRVDLTDGIRPNMAEQNALFAVLAIESAAASAERDARTAAAPTPYIEREPVVLYRSVSVAELADVIASGCLSGSRNAWAGGDTRHMVLFLDHESDLLRRQGEDARRPVLRTLSDHPVSLRVKELNRQVKQRTERDATLDAELRAATSALYQLTEPLVEAERKRRQESPWTSAVIRTVPMTGAMVWHRDHCDNLMDRTEYGFTPGAVRAEHIAKVTLFKDKATVRKSG